MTPSATDRPDMSIEEFEELARRAPETVSLEFINGRVVVKHGPIDVDDFEELARKAPETVTLELINGKLRVKPVPDGDHGSIIMWLIRQCMMQRPELGLHPEQGLRIDTCRKGCIKPDGALAPIDYFAGQGEWASPGGVLMTVEVTSKDRDTDLRDRQEKPGAYAYAGIPVYLLVDRDEHKVIVYSSPENGTYQRRRPYPYGATIRIPAPVALTLETEKLKDYAD
ncbi:Uma2 family endonuclease [Streptomyces sp. N35]|uniref:Uma2 family endonuclease n=1 Tax=Streptomyces sp. N35 TaxID=2795730 RepID=UPI001F2628A2|nr:Uma2 family endonuclease [Streptomyces sp. N35]